MPIAAEREAVCLTGFAGLPTFNRANSLQQFMFVNNRPLRDPLLAGALRAAYADVLARGRYPVAALYLDLDAAEVDINVHPAKLEARFRDPGLVRGLIVGAIRDALAERGFRASNTIAGATLSAFRPASRSEPRGGTSAGGNGGGAFRDGLRPCHGGFAEEAQAGFAVLDRPSADPRAAQDAPEAAALARPLGAARAQLHENYIVAQTDDGLVIVDQHAAHERIVYEKLKAGFGGRLVARQILLIPEVVELPRDDVERVIARAGELAEIGLVVEAFGPGALAVTETPAMLGELDAAALVRDLADDLAEWDSTTRLREHLRPCGRHHGMPWLRAFRPPPEARRNGRPPPRDGGDAAIRPVQSRPPDLCRVEAP